MEKRIFIAVVLSVVVLWGWAAIAPKLFPELVKPRELPRPSEEARARAYPPQSTAPAGSTTTTSPTTTATAAPAGAVPSTPVTPIKAELPVITTVDTIDYTARFSNRGAQLVSFQLKNYKNKSGRPVELVKARPADRTDFPFFIEAKDQAITNAANGALYAVESHVERSIRIVQYRYADGNGLSITKTFRVGPEFLFDFAVSISPPVPYRVAIGPGIRTLEAEERDTQVIITGDGLYQSDGKLKTVRREKADRLESFGVVDFIGIEDNYFLSALKPARAAEGLLRTVTFPVEGSKDKRRELYAAVNAAPDGTTSGSAFFGPKETTILEKFGLEQAMQFGMFGFIARMLLDVLVWINTFTKNYGFAIIVLTIIIKIVLYPLQHKSIVSMKKMQKAQPKMEAIKQKYKKARTDPEQRQKMNVEMMKLYQQEGINPMGGCLPILLQLPILWGFYGLLSRAIELRGAPFIFWIKDLSDKDPYYITPILMTVTMFIQTAITPSTADPMQKRIFMAMPLIFGFIFKDFPSGLVLYWLVQNVLTIAQQMIMNKYWKDHPNDDKKDRPKDKRDHPKADKDDDDDKRPKKD